jgi:hypothetical protein
MTNTHYLPGDRVRYNANHPGSLRGYRYAVGTFKNPTTLNPSMVTIDWDNAHHGKNSDHGFSFIERQPIEPGCWVRELPGENIFSNHGKPVQVVSVDGYYAEFPGFLGGTLRIGLHRLARVAEPKTPEASISIGGISFSVGENGATRVSLEADQFIYNDRRYEAITIDELTERENRVDKLREIIALYDGQITNLATFIASEIPGEPSQSEGAIDTAIRIMREQRTAIQTAARRLAKWVKDAPAGYGTEESRAWLLNYGTKPEPVVFKRGDLVTWGMGAAHYFIVAEPDAEYPKIMSKNGKDFRSDIRRSVLYHVETK